VLKTRSQPHRWPARPLWLLPRPEIANHSLTVISAAERIENGWWDRTDVRRDYYIACDPNGGCYWVYKTRHSVNDWYIHGVFA